VAGGEQAVPQAASLLLWVAITIPITATVAAPPISQRLGLPRWASRTPAGLPGARERSAAPAWEPISAAAATATIKAFLKFVIFPLSSLWDVKACSCCPITRQKFALLVPIPVILQIGFQSKNVLFLFS
jgi:hypothetical protein